jgi:hypothetical protein
MRRSRHNRKGRVLHTRVPEVLEVELKRLADSLSVPVSNIVRAVLEDALDAAETVEQDLQRDMRDAAERMASWRERRERRRRRWQSRFDERDARDDDDADVRERAARAVDARERTMASDDGQDDDALDAAAEAVRASDDEHAEEGVGTAPDAHDDDAAPELPPGVVGVQPMRMVRDGACLLCGRALARGADAFLGVGAISGPPVVVCEDCAP